MLYAGELVVIQPGAFYASIVPGKSQGIDEVQSGTGIGAQANYVARVGRNLGTVQDDVEHGEMLWSLERDGGVVGIDLCHDPVCARNHPGRNESGTGFF